jgi:hypothetical protein
MAKFDKRTKFEIDNAQKLVDIKTEQVRLAEELLNIETSDRRTKVYKEAAARNAEDRKDADQSLKLENKKKKALKNTRKEAKGAGDKAKEIGDSAEKFIKSAPGGGLFIKALGLEGLGDRMQKSLIEKIQQSTLATKGLGMVTKSLLGPIGVIIGLIGIVFTLITKVRKMNRKLANDLGITTSEAAKFQLELKASEFAFNRMGLDGSQLKGTMKSIGQEFGSLENMTVANARNIERFAQNSSVAGSEVVKLNKVFMDLDGLSFDAATNVSRVAADLAKAAGVSTAKVIGDMSSAAADFARFSMDGAEGMARAAVEAAKVGTNLGQILAAADNLLSFESSITAQFKAQVLTGKQINTERARQLALDGDIAGLTSEIQSIVGGVGDIQSLNVIQRKSVAEAIGISVSDLMKISRGEQVASQETVQDKIDTTNAILSKQYGIQVETLEGVKDKNFNFNQGAY